MKSLGGILLYEDADSEGVEGKFYVWSKDQIKRCWAKSREPFCAYRCHAQRNSKGLEHSPHCLTLDKSSESYGFSIPELENLLQAGERSSLLKGEAG